ncbi:MULTISPECIES: YlqD family protein [Shouchella]|uniref:YlqD family protein n=2 Tax=Shouchella TaxID=2893057 RepID=A0ABY7W4A6_9BACI|nr:MULTISPECIES: YlqD family protein [Shouchella]MED4127322.1 YlqD family protein [Shouchella miscanthi]WDF03797.1 YlqD family protein [Shouchella hunanensis]GAF23332.1 hypothetical protein JCM19047_3148 [Bacillus sp. JCM 19047]
MKCIRKASVKHVLTSTKRAELSRSFEEEKVQLDREIKQLEFQYHHAQKKTSSQMGPSLKEKFDHEINRRQEKQQSIQFKLDQLNHLAEGSELFFEMADVLIDVEIGAKWVSAENELTIVIKDGVVHEIRESENRDT